VDANDCLSAEQLGAFAAAGCGVHKVGRGLVSDGAGA
jgi:hypothetical protein